MKKSRFTEGQIIAILREQEAGMTTTDVCRKHGFSSPTFYAWRSTGTAPPAGLAAASSKDPAHVI